jgi:hypothetical protein
MLHMPCHMQKCIKESYTYVTKELPHTNWGPERPRIGGWSLQAVMSDWQRGVDWHLGEYCRRRLQLDLHSCRWRAGAKGLCLAGPPRSGETSRPNWRDPVASGAKCGPHGGRKARRSRRSEPVQGSGSQPESARWVCGSSPQNRLVTWLSHKTKTGGSAGEYGIRTCREASKWRTCVGIASLASRLSDVRSSGIRPMVLWREFLKCPSGRVS